MEKTHYRKAFKSPYLSSGDIVGDTVFTIEQVKLEPDKTKRTKEDFNTAYFKEKKTPDGLDVKPMILNVTNSEFMRKLTGSKYLEDWAGSTVTVYVDPNVKNRGEIVDGLRLKKAADKQVITPDNETMWEHATNAYLRDGNFDKVLRKAVISEKHQKQIIEECKGA